MEEEDEPIPTKRFERSTTPKGLASLLAARVLGRNLMESYDDASTPSSVITTSAAAFVEYASLGVEDETETGRPGGETDDLATPLVDEEGSVVTSMATTSTRLNHATAALTNTIVGAGIVALPRVFESLGVVPGALLLAAFFYLSRYTLAAMMRSANTVGVWTYDELVRSQFGDWGARSLDAAIVVNNLGGLLVYLIIIGAAAGFLATRMMRLETDIVTTMAIGIAGALIGGFLLRFLLSVMGMLGGLIGAVMGAMLVIWVWQKYFKR